MSKSLGELLKEKLDSRTIESQIRGRHLSEAFRKATNVVVHRPDTIKWELSPYQFNRESTDMNVNLLLALASTAINNDLAEFGAEMPTDLREELERQIAEERKDRSKKAATEILTLLKETNLAVTNKVAGIHRLQASIAEHKKALAKIKRAKAFGLATQNFLPLVKLVDDYGYESAMRNLSTDQRLKLVTEVPQDWKEPEAPTA